MMNSLVTIQAEDTTVTNLDMRLYLYHNFVEMLYNGTIDSACQIDMLSCNDSCFISDPIIDVLRCAIKPEATTKQKLISLHL